MAWFFNIVIIILVTEVYMVSALAGGQEIKCMDFSIQGYALEYFG